MTLALKFEIEYGQVVFHTPKMNFCVKAFHKWTHRQTDTGTDSMKALPSRILGR